MLERMRIQYVIWCVEDWEEVGGFIPSLLLDQKTEPRHSDLLISNITQPFPQVMRDSVHFKFFHNYLQHTRH